jgi:hypothetical protein
MGVKLYPLPLTPQTVTENIIDSEWYRSNKSALLFLLIIKDDNCKFCEAKSKKSVEVYRGRNFHTLLPSPLPQTVTYTLAMHSPPYHIP